MFLPGLSWEVEGERWSGWSEGGRTFSSQEQQQEVNVPFWGLLGYALFTWPYKERNFLLRN